MRDIYLEVIDEFAEIKEKGTGHLRRRTRKCAPVSPVKHFEPHEIKAIREKNQFTQSYFGEFLGVSLKTVQAWEAGTNRPMGTTLRIFQILEQDPNALDKFILTKV